jgi:hypothetical protein
MTQLRNKLSHSIPELLTPWPINLIESDNDDFSGLLLKIYEDLEIKKLAMAKYGLDRNDIMKYFLMIYVIPLFLISCGSSKSECSELRELSINPTEGIGPYQLGMSEADLVSVLCPEFTKKVSKALFYDKKTTYYFIKNMSFIFRNDRLKEISVWGTFKGSYEDIDLDYDKETLEAYGDVVEYKGEYRILDIPHISFGMENSDEGKFIKIY